MNSDLWNRASEVFAEAVELDAAARNDFVQKRCGDDGELRAEVEAMLAEDAQATQDSFLTPAVASPGVDITSLTGQPADAMIGEVIGPYRIDRMIGQGGMGNVYLAVRTSDFTSQVAIKLIRHGMNSQAIVDRFQNEIQVQASLGQHHNIAGIVDAGQTDHGLPYFVMEYVEGQRIDEYCDSNRLNTSQRMELFLAVCSAIQFAHQNAVIHRDLKPSNILVTNDGRPVLIDFGIAKLVEASGGDGEIDVTQTEGRAFTPGYASPEQVSGKPLTTASDVYSLGIVLYEVLTGRKPYKMDPSSVSSMVDVVLKQNPARPSEVVLNSDTVSDHVGDTREVTPDEISRQRDTSVRRLQQQLHGDLDQVVLKSLHKDPARRYPTIDAFESDLRNVVTGHPVSARPDSVGYRTSKFVQRNKVPVAIATMLVVSLVAGTVGTALGLVRANSEWRRAEANAKEATEQGELALRKARDAQQVVRDFYTNVSEEQLFDRPSLQPLRQEFLDEALAYYRNAHKENPADQQVEHELGDLLVRVAIARESSGDMKGATSANSDAIEILEGAESRAGTDGGSEQFDAAVIEVVKQARRQVLARAYLYQALFVARQGDAMGAFEWFDKSESILAEEISQNPDDIQLQRAMAELHSAIGFHWSGSPTPERGRSYVEQSLQRRLAIRESDDATEYDDHDLARSHWEMGYAYRLDAAKQSGKVRNELFDNALAEYDKSLAILTALVEQQPTSLRFQQILGEVHASIGTIHFNRNKRGNLSADERRVNDENALKAYKRSLAIREQMVQQNPGVGRLEYVLSRGYMQVATQQKLLGEVDEAIINYDRALAIRREMLEEDKDDLQMRSGLGTLLNNVGLLHLEREGGLELALECFTEAVQFQREVVDSAPNNPKFRFYLANHLLNVGLVKRREGDFREAANQILAAKKVSPGNPEQMLIIAKHEAKLAALASEANDPAAAELLEKAVQTIVALTNANMIDREELSHSDFDLVRETPAIQTLLSESSEVDSP